jgi:predicted dehydrogenase
VPATSGLQRFEGWEALIRSPVVDAVSICVPHHLHEPIARAALEAGKHVLIEKPLATDASQARELIELAERRERVLMVELTHRFYPPVRAASEWVRSGRVGEIFAVEDRIIEPAAEQIQPWLTQRQTAGGGVALTNGIHMLDRIAFVTGQSLSFVRGVAGFSAGLGDVEDTAAMLLSLEKGAAVQLLAAWPRGHRKSCDDELTIYGTYGVLRVWAWRGWKFEPIEDGASTVQDDCYAGSDDLASRVRVGVAGAMREFASAILDRRPCDPPAVAAMAAQEIVDRFYRHSLLQQRGSGKNA